jgi:hypothetical protein
MSMVLNKFITKKFFDPLGCPTGVTKDNNGTTYLYDNKIYGIFH